MWPDPLTPGMDWVRDMAGGRLAVERERECEPERGEVVRGRYGMAGEDQEGDVGERVGSVLRRMVRGLRRSSNSEGEKLGWL